LSFVEQLDMMECTDIAINFGQWQLGWPLVKDENASYSMSEYKRQIKAVLSQMVDGLAAKLKLDKQASVYWLSTNPHPFIGEVTHCPPEGYRFPLMIARYKEASEEALAELREKDYNIGYIDNYEISKHLNDVTSDGSHYFGVANAAAFEKNMADCLGFP